MLPWKSPPQDGDQHFERYVGNISWGRCYADVCSQATSYEWKPYSPPDPPAVPPFRFTKDNPFTYTDVDFTGTIYIKRRRPTYRFTHVQCLFIRNFRRFITRRGLPLEVKSDNGRKFKAISKKLSALQTEEWSGRSIFKMSPVGRVLREWNGPKCEEILEEGTTKFQGHVWGASDSTGWNRDNFEFKTSHICIHRRHGGTPDTLQFNESKKVVVYPSAFEPMISVISMRYSTNWAMNPRWKQVKCEFNL